MTLTAANDATMSGTFVNNSNGESGAIVGGTHPEGAFNAQFKVNGSAVVIAITGTMAGSAADGNKGDGT